jgi:hypothetical protein
MMLPFEKMWKKGKMRESYSDLGFKIYAYNELLKSKKGGGLKSNLVVANRSKELDKKGSFLPGITPLVNREELRKNLGPEDLEVSDRHQRAQQIVKTLTAMLKIKGIEITGELKSTARVFRVPYRHFEEKSHPVRPFKMASANFKKVGLENVITNDPIRSGDFKQELLKAYELRILQSAFYDQHQTAELIDNAIEKGTLTRVKILLAQPHSNAAKERAHTYGNNDIDQLPFFNSRIWEAVTRLQRLQFKYHDKVNPETGERISIKVRLYARPPVIPVYQLRDASGRSRMIRFGIFWRQASSFDSPHFQVWGNEGILKETIEDHFDTIWDDLATKSGKGKPKSGKSDKSGGQKVENKLEEELLDLDKINGQDEAYRYSRSFTIKVDLENESIPAVRERFEGAREVRFLFPWATKQRSDYLYFKCYYFKPNDTASSCALRFDRSSSTVSVSNTNQGSIYRGVAVRRHNSFAMFLVGVNEGANQRIMTLNIPVGGGSMDRMEHFAIYSNIDIDDGSPYSQLMLLHRIDKETFDSKDPAVVEEGNTKPTTTRASQLGDPLDKREKSKYDAVDDEIDLSQYLPYLKDRRISLPSLLWNRPLLKVDQTQGNYQQFFSADEHATYFSLLTKEVAYANANIYFFGYPPSSEYEGTELKKVKGYYKKHLDLMTREDKPVNLHRYVLDPVSLTGKFMDYIRELFRISESTKGGQFYLYLADSKYPVDADLILIDPDTARSTSISSYMRDRLVRAGKIPIRLDVIKDGEEIQKHKLKFCLSFNELNLVHPINTYEKLQQKLKELGIKVSKSGT